MPRSVLDVDLPIAPFSPYSSNPAFSEQQDHSCCAVTLPPNSENEMGARCASNISNIQAIAIIICVTASTATSTILSALVTVSTPDIAREFGLGLSSRLWSVKFCGPFHLLGKIHETDRLQALSKRPTSIISLTCGSSLLIAGSLSDIIGGSTTYIIGSSLQMVFALGCGLSQSGAQLIILRGLGGIATAFCLSSTVRIIDTVFPGGQRRNLAFASMGGGQPVGFGIGVTLGGVSAGTIGWRWGFRISCLLNVVVLILSSVSLPKKRCRVEWRRVVFDVDWFGSFLLTSSFAMLLYVLS